MSSDQTFYSREVNLYYGDIYSKRSNKTAKKEETSNSEPEKLLFRTIHLQLDRKMRFDI
jgi:hypothetical protein